MVADILINCGYTLYDADQPTHMRVPIPFAAPNTLGSGFPTKRLAMPKGQQKTVCTNSVRPALLVCVQAIL